MIHQIDNQHFDLTWKDNNQTASNPWRTERWERCQEPEEFRKVMAAYDECQERTDCFKGVWRIVAFLDRLSGDLVKVPDEQYKFYGKDRYFIVATRWENQEKAIALSAATVVLLNMWTAACSEKEDKTSLSNG